MNKIESHKFCGKKFQIVWDKLTEKEIEDLVKRCNLEGPPPAFCETRDSRKPKVKFDIDAYDDAERLRIVLDEAIHACLFELDNEFVDKMAKSIAKFLWELGYRDTSALKLLLTKKDAANDNRD